MELEYRVNKSLIDVNSSPVVVEPASICLPVDINLLICQLIDEAILETSSKPCDNKDIEIDAAFLQNFVNIPTVTVRNGHQQEFYGGEETEDGSKEIGQA